MSIFVAPPVELDPLQTVYTDGTWNAHLIARDECRADRPRRALIVLDGKKASGPECAYACANVGRWMA
jgi:hypothetical protein